VRPSMWSAICWSAVLTMCAAGTARAQATSAPATPPPATGEPVEVTPATGTPRWTVDSGETVGAGANVAAAAVGYPGLDLRLIHGLNETTDVNAHVGFNYAFEGITQGTRFEFTAQVGIRKELLKIAGNMKLSGKFDPGILWAASPGQFGIKLPIGIEMGIPMSHVMMLNGSLDLPMFFTVGDFSAFYIPLLFGGGIEYLLQPNLAVTGKIKLGPTFITNGGGTQFTLYLLAGAAYKF
jgi:hypothetical protein